MREELTRLSQFSDQSDKKIIQQQCDIKKEHDREMADLNEYIAKVERYTQMLKRENEEVERRFVETNKEINEVHKESCDVLRQLEHSKRIMCTKMDAEYLIEKTKIMCDQFNFAVHDLRNQIDTTDTYIENYLPLKTVKEISSIL
jgi:sugar-specific transcriptional regulator TrmB